MKAILYGYDTANREALLRSRLTTEWDLVAIPDAGDLDKVRAELADADTLIGNAFPDGLREAGASLKLIHCTGAGVDAIPLANLPPGCMLCNVHEHEVPVAEHVMLTILLFVTHLLRLQERFRRGEWEGSGRSEGEFHDEAYGKTLGLIGYGHIGREVARRAKAFGMKVAAVARKPQRDPGLDWYGSVDELDSLIEMSDFLVVVCPLTPETRGLLGERELRKMKPSAFLINVARAEIVEEEPLHRALSQRWFAGAALDVWYEYPPRPGVRQHGSQFAFHELDNVIVTPHSSAWTGQLIRRRYEVIAANLDRLARGELLQNVVHQAAVGVQAG